MPDSDSGFLCKNWSLSSCSEVLLHNIYLDCSTHHTLRLGLEGRSTSLLCLGHKSKFKWEKSGRGGRVLNSGWRSVHFSVTHWLNLFSARKAEPCGGCGGGGGGGRWQWHPTHLLFSSQGTNRGKLKKGKLPLTLYTPVPIYTWWLHAWLISHSTMCSVPSLCHHSDCIRLWVLINFLLCFFFHMKDSGSKHQVSALAQSSCQPIFPQRSQGNHGNWLLAQWL